MTDHSASALATPTTIPINVPIKTQPQDPQSEPIINSPFEPPDWHWWLDSSSIAIGPAAAGRRDAQFMPAVPDTKSKTTREQPALQHADSPHQRLKLVNEIREAVAQWQTAGFPGVTDTTRRLLNYWTDADGDLSQQSDCQLYFAQVDAVLTHIYLKETKPPQFTERLLQINAEYNFGINRICHKMATGAGKTLAMAMLMLWAAANHRKRPNSSLFTNRFLLLTPGITVMERLQASLNPLDDQSDFHQFPITPPGPEWEVVHSHIKTHFANWQQLEAQTEASAASSWGKSILQGGDQPQTPEEIEQQKETAEDVIHRLAAPGYKDSERVLVINDESHHCHCGDPAKPNQTPTKWFAGLQMLKEASRLLYAIDMSATPTYIAQANPKPVDWIVSDYALIDAMEAGLVKIPQLPTALGDKATNPQYRDLYANSTPEDRKTFKADDTKNNQLLKQAIADLYADYAQEDQRWQAGVADPDQPEDDTVPPYRPRPVIAIIMNEVDNANRVYEYIAEANAADFCELLSNAIDPEGIPNTILVHSQLDQAEKDAKVPAAMSGKIKALAERFQRHYPGLKGLKPEQIIRRVMNTVGKPGQPGEKVRCVISVNMLTEGWDTKTVTHLLGFRRFGTSLLCEQAAGRTLRRTNFEPNNGAYRKAEYAKIIGIPFPQYGGDSAAMKCPHCNRKLNACVCKRVTPIDITASLDNIAYAIDLPSIAMLHRSNKLNSIRLKLNQDPEYPCPLNGARRTPPQRLIPSIGQITELIGDEPTATFQRFAYIVGSAVAYKVKETHKATLESNDNELTLLTGKCFADAVTALRKLKSRNFIPDPTANGGAYPADVRVIDNAAEWLLETVETILPDTPSQIMMSIDPNDKVKWINTEKLKDYSVHPDQANLYGPTRNSHITYANCDSRWEVTTAEELDNCPEVIRWVRNHRLNWFIPYVEDGQPRRYYPDFVAVTKLPGSSELHIIVEVKGIADQQDWLKKQWTEDYWIPAVNAHAEYGKAAGKVWTYLYLDSEDKCRQAGDYIRQAIADHSQAN